MIIKEKISNSFNLFLKEMYGDQFGEFVCGYLGLKGSLSNNWMRLSMICRIMRRVLCIRPIMSNTHVDVISKKGKDFYHILFDIKIQTVIFSSCLLLLIDH